LKYRASAGGADLCGQLLARLDPQVRDDHRRPFPYETLRASGPDAQRRARDDRNLIVQHSHERFSFWLRFALVRMERDSSTAAAHFHSALKLP
jgi:hypothetical protein